MAKDEAVSVTGGCLCGAIRFAAAAYMRSAYYCHCTMCQKSTGEPFEIGIPIKVGTLRFTKGAPTYYRSSAFGRRGFCAACGSRLLWAPTDAKNEWTTNVAVCAIDNPADVRPNCHIFTETMLPWLKIPDGLPNFLGSEMGPVLDRWRAERT